MNGLNVVSYGSIVYGYPARSDEHREPPVSSENQRRITGQLGEPTTNRSAKVVAPGLTVLESYRPPVSLLRTIGTRGVATAKGQVTAWRENGPVDYLRTRPHAALQALGYVLLTMDSMRMDSAEVHRHWAERTGSYSPEFYADYGPDSGSRAIHAVLDEHVDTDAAILELGCGGGRHLAYLHEYGYENLYGIDINDDAAAVMEESYPQLADAGTFYFDAIEEIVPAFDDAQFDVVFSVETLQHIHPDNEWVFEDVARITDDLLLTMENEPEDDRIVSVDLVDDFPLYYRQWGRVFTDLGLTQVTSSQGSIDTFRVFRQPDSEK